MGSILFEARKTSRRTKLKDLFAINLQQKSQLRKMTLIHASIYHQVSCRVVALPRGLLCPLRTVRSRFRSLRKSKWNHSLEAHLQAMLPKMVKCPSGLFQKSLRQFLWRVAVCVSSLDGL